jgi:hypothetical protein
MKGDSMKSCLLLAFVLTLASCGQLSGVYDIEFTTSYSDHYVLSVHADGNRVERLEYQATQGSHSKMPFTTFFRYDGTVLVEIYTLDQDGNRTVNYEASAKNVWPLVFISDLVEDYEKDGKISLAKVIFDTKAFKLVLANSREESIVKTQTGIGYMANEISRRGKRIEVSYTLTSGKIPLFTYTFDRRLTSILDIR